MQHAFRKALWGIVLASVLLLPQPALAQDEAEDRPDARVEGYAISGANGQNQVGRVMLEGGGGYATTWFILAGLGVVGLGVMFKAGKRTHLD